MTADTSNIKSRLSCVSGVKLFLCREGTFRVTSYYEGCERQIVELFKKVFGHEKSLQWWSWEFRNNPYGTFITLGFLKGEIVTQCASTPAKMVKEGKIFTAAQLVDCMSHPSVRGIAIKKKGLFVLTVEFFYKLYTGKGKIEFLYGFPNWRHFKLGSIFLGYKPLSSISELVVHPSEGEDRKKIKIFNPGEETFLKKHFTSLFHRDTRLVKFSIAKNWDYLKWRYFEHPSHKYKVVGLLNTWGTPKALAIVREDDRFIYLMDCFNLDMLADMLKAVPKAFGKPLKAWFPAEHIITKRLNNMGFSMTPPSIKAVPGYVSFSESLSDQDWVQKNFYYTMGDSDLF